MAGRESISESSTIEGKHQINRGIQVRPLFVEEIATRIVSAEGDSPTFSPPTIIRAQTPSSVVSQYIRDQALLVTDMVLLSLASCHQKVHRDQAHLNYLLSQSLSNLNFQLLLPGIRNHSQNLPK